MSEQSIRWRRAVPVAALALTTVAGLASAATAAADPLGASGAAKGSPQVTRPVADTCTLSPSLTHPGGERSSCLAVGVQLSRLPAVGQTATLTVTVKSARAEQATDVSVDLPSSLVFADGTKAAAATTGAGKVARASLARYDLAKGDTRTVTRTVRAVATGFGGVTARASNVVSKSRTDGGVDSLFLTVGATSSFAGGGAAATAAKAGAVTRAGASATPSTPTSTHVTALPALAKPAKQASAKAAAPGTSCATGHWFFTDQTGATRGAHNVVVQVYNSSNTLLASQYSGGDGSYNVCYSTGGATTSIYVQFREDNNVWTLHDLSNNVFFFSTGTVSVPDNSTHDFGNLQPADGTQMPGLHAYQEADDEYQWMYGFDAYQGGCWSPLETTCRQLVIHWQKDNTATGTFWNSSGAYLLAGSPDTLDEPVHEYGHALMYNLYGQTFPATTNCGSHDLFVTSSTTCAMTEGWADWVATSVYNNMVWTYNGGFQRDMNQTWGDAFGYPTGDQVEARVTQAMRSLTDPAKYPYDNDPGEGGGIRDNSRFFAVLHTYKPNTFSAFWSGRAAAGQDVSQTALSALFQGTIDYGFRNPLTDGVSKNMPQAVVPMNYSAGTTRGYWSAVAVRPQDGSDSDVTLYNDAAQTSSLGSSAYGGSTTDFVAINSNSGARALQTYYPRITRFTGTGNYTVEYLQGSTVFNSGATTVTTSSANPINIMDSNQTSGVPVYYRAVPQSGQSLGLVFLQPGQTILGRSSAVNGSVGGPGDVATLVATPSASGYGGLVVVNQGMTSGSVNLYADTTAPTGGSIVIDNGAAITNSLDVTLTIGTPTDAETGVASMQISTDGTFDTEPVIPFATSATATLSGQNGTKPVYVRFMNNAGMWSAPVLDRIKQQVKPQVDSLSKTSGPQAGGTVLSIVGRRFTGATSVQFGSTVLTTFTIVNDTKINVTIPAGTGTVHVRVRNPYGLSDATAGDQYAYVALPTITALSKNTGSAAGGNVIFITGTGFTGTTAVKFGTTPAAAFTVVSPTRIQVTTPAVPASTVHIRVTSVGGTTAATTADQFTFH